MPILSYASLLKEAATDWINDNVARMGAALAFYTVLSLAPLLLIALTVASAIWGDAAAAGQMTHEISSLVGINGAQVIQSILAAPVQNKSAGVIASILGFGMSLFGASGMFTELQEAMNIIWKTPQPKESSLWKTVRERFVAFLMVIGSSLLLLLSLGLSAALTWAGSLFEKILPFIKLGLALDVAASLGMTSFLFALLFKALPDADIPWRSVWPGAVLTSLLFIVGKFLIAFYLAHAAVASQYGEIGSVIALLLWIYYSAQILFFGAEFCHVYNRTRRLSYR